VIIVLQGPFIGVLATVLIDIWALILRYVFKLPTTNWAMVGRWVGHLYKGRFAHERIADAASVTGETPLGWLTHYAIGMLYGLLYLWLMRDCIGQRPGLLSAIVFSLLMLVAPWLILQPGLGVGVFARRAPRPWLTRATNVSVHVVFGMGLYAGWRLLGQWAAFE
jgi:Protein of unknown function (DUF2938)